MAGDKALIFDVSGEDLNKIGKRFGALGVGFVVMLLGSIRKAGYKLELTIENVDRLKKTFKINDVIFWNMMGLALDLNIFDREIYDEYGVLTSASIQREYLERPSVKSIPQSYHLPDVTYIDVRAINAAAKNAAIEVVALYNEMCPGLHKAVGFNNARSGLINARLRENGLEKVKEMFQKAQSSAFLNGENDRHWIPSFDWIMRSANFLKILEGAYDNGGKAGEAGKITLDGKKEAPPSQSGSEFMRRLMENYDKE
ncbi:MAG: DUF4373 domain-containing protein [Oscillospiraceae bacterium]